MDCILIILPQICFMKPVDDLLDFPPLGKKIRVVTKRTNPQFPYNTIHIYIHRLRICIYVRTYIFTRTRL